MSSALRVRKVQVVLLKNPTSNVWSIAMWGIVFSPGAALAQSAAAIVVNGPERAPKASRTIYESAQNALEAEGLTVAPASAVRAAIRFAAQPPRPADQLLSAVRETMGGRLFAFRLMVEGKTYSLQLKAFFEDERRTEYEETDRRGLAAATQVVIGRALKKRATMKGRPPSAVAPVPPEAADALSAKMLRLNGLEAQHAKVSDTGFIVAMEALGYVVTGMAVVAGVIAAAAAKNEGNCGNLGFDACGPPIVILSAIGVLGLGIAIPMTLTRLSRNRRAEALRTEIDGLRKELGPRSAIPPFPRDPRLGFGSARLTFRF